MADATTSVTERLRRLRRALGNRAHADAVRGALHAIGAAALREAERRARLRDDREDGHVG